MAIYRVGETEVDLKVVGAGLRNGELPLVPMAAMAEEVATNLGFSPREMNDFNAFSAAGWQLLPGHQDLAWRNVKPLNAGEEVHAGLLARYPSGGLVILQDRLVLKAAHGVSPASLGPLQTKYLRVRPLGSGDEN